MRDRFNLSDSEYWANVCIAFAQVSFGFFLGAWFLPPFDFFKLVVILSNLVITTAFILLGLWFKRRKK